MPTRYLKPGICDSELINNCSSQAENLFYRLLVNVDDFGRLDARVAVVRSKCFPLKDDLSNKDTENLLLELQKIGLIKLYKSNDCMYLQMQKWDNIPRAKESKCPAQEDECLQTYANVCSVNTNLPVTVTETVNRKPELKPITVTGTVTPRKKRSDPKNDETESLQTACKITWMAYCDAYGLRYAVDPVRNAKVSSQIKLLVGRLGAEDSPHVAAHYLQSNTAYYVTRGHSVDGLLADAEKLRTEWATGRSMTTTRARQIDQSQANASCATEAMEIYNRMKGENDEKII